MSRTADTDSLTSLGVAARTDLAAIRGLLEQAGLPHTDLSESALQHFLVARDGDAVCGAVGIEVHGRIGLLRSLVVSSEFQGRGLGTRLATGALQIAHDSGCDSVFLLTTTASTFFQSRGFRSIDRNDAPAAIQATSQFSALCPATAVLMVRATGT